MITPLPPLSVYPLEMPALRGSEAIFPGIYFAITACKSARNFRGGVLVESLDDWDSHGTVSVVRKLSTVGICEWLSESALRVELLRGELESCTPGIMRLGHNRAMVADELVGFQKAELQDDGAYILYVPLRAERGTPRRQFHGGGIFVLVDDSLIFQEIAPDMLGVPRQYKAACSGQDLDRVVAVHVAPKGLNARDFTWIWDKAGT